MVRSIIDSARSIASEKGWGSLIQESADYLYYNYVQSRALLWHLKRVATIDLGEQHAKFKLGSNSTRYLCDAWARLRAGSELELLFLKNDLDAGGIFVDVGAFVGLHSVFAAKIMAPGGSVLAYEPDPVARRILINNIELNRLSNIKVSNAAISNQSGLSWLGAKSTMLGKSISRLGLTSARGCLVQTVKLDDELRNAGPVRLIKIDVEGHEPEVLAGGQGIICEPRVSVLLEFHTAILCERGINPRQFFRSLFMLRKSVYRLSDFVRGEKRKCSPDEPIWGGDGCEWIDNHLLLERSTK